MKRLITCIVLLTFSNTAMAEWIRIHSGNEFDTYIDTTSIRKNGNRVKMWTLTDYKKKQNTGSGYYFSKKAQYEFDCQDETQRVASVADYSGKMGQGKLVSSFTPNPYEYTHEPVIPDTLGEVFWKLLCLN